MNTILRPGVVTTIHTVHRSVSLMAGVVENSIRTKLMSNLGAQHLDVINESYMHNVPKGAETHFKVVVVSEKFEGLPLLKSPHKGFAEPQGTAEHTLSMADLGVCSCFGDECERHRLVNDILKEELQCGVHALSIVAKTPQQWDSSDKVVESSPSCKGGFGK